MNLDENDLARMFNVLDVDDAPRAEHKDSLRKHVLAEYDRHAESAVHFWLEPGGMNLETGARGIPACERRYHGHGSYRQDFSRGASSRVLRPPRGFVSRGAIEGRGQP
jgi:hypothetical protein